MGRFPAAVFIVPVSLAAGILAFVAATTLEMYAYALLDTPFRAGNWAIANMVVAGIASGLTFRFLAKRQPAASAAAPEADGIDARAARRRARRAARTEKLPARGPR